MKLKPYPKYKDSGIEWIGEIPEGWEVNKIKFLLEKPIVDGPHETPEFIEKGFPFLSVDSIQDGKLVFENCRYISEKDHVRFKTKCNPKKDDILMGKAASIGKIAMVDVYFEFSIWSPLALLRANQKKIISKFFEYVLKSDYAQDQIEIFATSNTQKNISMDDIPRIILIVPPLDEQNAIASFLDKKTSQLNKLIEKNQKLIELLKEKRTALINHAVTKGLDPDAKMKDSGIEWIGEIPEGWEVNKIKNTSYVKGRIGWHGLTSEEYSDEGAYLVTGTDFKNGFIEWENCYHVGWNRYKEDPYIHLKYDDLLITKDGTIGKVALIDNLPDKATLNSGIFLVRALNKKYLTRFMYWMLNSAVFERFFDYIKTGATISHLYQETFEGFFFPIPPKPEQTAIAQYLDKATEKIDKTIKLIEKKIELLEEYKKSLIHHVVTGKVDVREVEA